MSEAGAKKSENVTFDMEGLVKAVSTKSGINAPQAQKVLRVAMAMISEQIQKGAQTRVPGLGTFLPRTAEGKTRVVFRPAAKKDRQAAMGKTKKEG